MKTLLLLLVLAAAVHANEAVAHRFRTVALTTDLPPPFGSSTLVLSLEDAGIRTLRGLALRTADGKEIAAVASTLDSVVKPSLDELAITSVVTRPGVHQVMVRVPFQRLTDGKRYEKAFLQVVFIEGAVSAVRVIDAKGVELEKRQ